LFVGLTIETGVNEALNMDVTLDTASDGNQAGEATFRYDTR